jgi:hypothetical protein
MAAPAHSHDHALRGAVLVVFTVFAVLLNFALYFAVYTAFVDDTALSVHGAERSVTPAVLVALAVATVLQIAIGFYAFRRSRGK